MQSVGNFSVQKIYLFFPVYTSDSLFIPTRTCGYLFSALRHSPVLSYLSCYAGPWELLQLAPMYL